MAPGELVTALISSTRPRLERCHVNNPQQTRALGSQLFGDKGSTMTLGNRTWQSWCRTGTSMEGDGGGLRTGARSPCWPMGHWLAGGQGLWAGSSSPRQLLAAVDSKGGLRVAATHHCSKPAAVTAKGSRGKGSPGLGGTVALGLTALAPCRGSTGSPRGGPCSWPGLQGLTHLPTPIPLPQSLWPVFNLSAPVSDLS